MPPCGEAPRRCTRARHVCWPNWRSAVVTEGTFAAWASWPGSDCSSSPRSGKSGALGACVLSPKRAKEFADVLGQCLWLLERREVPAPRLECPALDVGECLFRQPPRRVEDIFREPAVPHRDLHLPRTWQNPALVLPGVVRVERAPNGASHPVQHDVGQQPVSSKARLHVATRITPGAEFLDDPACKPHR